MAKKQATAAGPVDYDELLDRAWDELPDDPILPDGTWHLSVVSATRVKATEDKSEQVIIFLKAKSPLDDVDTAALEALGSGFDYGAAKLNYTIWIEGPGDLKKVGRFLKMAGIEDKVPNLNSLAKVRGAGGTILGQLKQRTYVDKKTGDSVTVMDVKQVAADE